MSNIAQQQADQKKATAEAENDLSHTAAKAGPFTLSSTGAIAQDSPDRTQGSWNQTVGAAKESIGNLIGAQGLKQEGIQQNREGKNQEAQGQLSDLGQGVKDRVGGTVGGARRLRERRTRGGMGSRGVPQLRCDGAGNLGVCTRRISRTVCRCR